MIEQPVSRRQLLKSSSAGFGYVALSAMLAQSQRARADVPARPANLLAPRQPHFPVKAKRIIFLFMEGAMSQMDTWEYKPTLQRSDGMVGPGGGTLTASKFRFARHGQTGTWVSNLFPHMARHVDKLCFIRGLHTDTPAHPQAVIQLHTGTALAQLTRPSMGAWLLYGLGTENQDLPGYITINPPPNFGGAINYGTAFLPAHYQGTRISDTGVVPNLRPAISQNQQRRQLDLIQAMNRDLAQTPGLRPGGRGDPVLRVGLPMQPRAGVARYLAGAPSGARCVWRQARPGRQLRQAMPDGSPAERGGRPLRRDLPVGLGPSQQSAPGPDQPVLACGQTDGRAAWPTWNAAACSRKRWCFSAASSAGCRHRRAPTAGTTTSPATRCCSPGPE